MGLFSKKKKTDSENKELVLDEKQKQKIEREKKRLEDDPSYAAKQFLNATKEFEKNLFVENEKSKAIAWRVTAGSCAITVLALIGIAGLTPLKTVEPLIFRVDNNTGKVDIVSTLKNAQADYGEEVNKYFLAQYVKCREGYDWYTIQQTFNCAMLMSSEEEQNRLNNAMARIDAPHKVLQNKFRVNIKVNNVSFIGDGQAQVRYEKITEPSNGGQYIAASGEVEPKPQVERKIATITYDYRNAPKKEEERYVNPLGWTAQTYRNDTESGVN